MLAAVYWARAPRVVLPDRALCLPTFCHSLLTVNKSSSSSSSSLPLSPTRLLFLSCLGACVCGRVRVRGFLCTGIKW